MPPANPAADRAPAERILLGLALAYAALLAHLALSRFETFHNRTFDLAEYARIAWGLAHGDTWDPIVDVPLRSGHLSFVLLPLGVLGRAFGTVRVLLLAQALALALASLPLARIGQRHLGPRGLWIGALAYLLHPNLGHVAAYEFHPGNLAILPLAHALDALDRRAPRPLLSWALAMLLCRADFALCTGMLGVTALWSGGPLRRPGGALILLSLGYLGVVVALRTGARVSGSAVLHFGPWGGSPLGVLAALLQDPSRVLRHFSAPERLSYLPRILAPLLLLPLAAPRMLLPALPFAAINLLSVFPTTTRIDSHYLTPAVPSLVAAALLGAGRIAPHLRQPRLAWLLPGAAGVASLWLGGLPLCRAYPAADFQPGPGHGELFALVGRIDPGASVQAPDRLLPHLAERQRVHRAPPPERETDFVVLDVGHRQRFAGREDLLRTDEEPEVRRWLARPDHALRARAPGLLLLQRGLAPRLGLAARYFMEPEAGAGRLDGPGRRLCACLSITGAVLGAGRLNLAFRAHGPCPADLAIRIGSEMRPSQVDLLFDGLLSPALLQAGDRLRSFHTLSPERFDEVRARGLRVGLLRASGAPPEPGDPLSIAQPTLARIIHEGAR